MTGSSVDPGEWLCATFRGVQTAMVETDEPTAFSEALVDRVGGVESHALVWVGRVTNGGDIRVYAATAQRNTGRVKPDLPSDIDGPSHKAVETDRAQIHTDISDNPEYDAFAELVDTAPAASLTVPVGGRRVLTLYTTSADTLTSTGDVDPLLTQRADELAAAIEWGYQSFETKRELTRERERLERVRSVVSHDLGNPLNVAAGRLSLAADECNSEHIAHVESGLDQIEVLADETLQFVEMSRRVKSREAVSLATCARSCWSTLDTGRSTLDVTDGTVEADPERFRQLLSELFENALVHADGPVTVTVGPLADRPGVFVADDGPGIPEDEREYVLDSGYSTLPDRDGNGLAIAAAIADAHDWTLDLRHEDDGTRVEVETTRW